MIWSLEERYRALLEAIGMLEERLAEGERLLVEAPPWFGPELSLRRTPVRLRDEARRQIEVRAELGGDRDLLARLKREVEMIELGLVDWDRCYREALGWLNAARSAKTLLRRFRQDPLSLLAIGERPLPEKVAQRILEARDEVGGELAELEQLERLEGLDKWMLRDLFYSVCWKEPEPPPSPTIGVLLPVRLETRFTPPAGTAGWKLRVRIVPDAPSIDRHESLATDAELDSVESMWQAASAGLGTPEGQAAWQVLVDRHGGPRAAWLARTYPPNPPGPTGAISITRPAQTRQDPTFDRIRGFPPTIELWLARAGTVPTRIAQLSVKTADLLLDFPDPTDPSDTRWWSSWSKALDVGLAAEIDIGPSAPADIDALYAVGLGTDNPAGLFQAHRDAGVLAVIEPGTPTNTVAGQPAADLGRGAESWHRVVQAAGIVEPSTAEIGAALTGDASALGPLPNGDLDHRSPGQAMVGALWPALWGHTLKDILGLGEDVHRLALWASQNLVPEGHLPPIRIDDQPYGLLPVTCLRKWQAGANDPPVEAAMVPSLDRLRTAWAAAAESAGNVEGADAAALLSLVGRTPASKGYAHRPFISLELLHVLKWAYGTGVSAAALNLWWEQTCREVLGYPARIQRRYATLGWPQDVTLPLVMPTNVQIPNQTLADLLMRLLNGSPAALTAPGGLGELFRGKAPDSLLIRLAAHSLVVSAAEVYRASQLQTQPALEAVTADAAQPTALAAAARAMTPQQLGSNPASIVFHLVRASLATLGKSSVKTLERIMRATLDTASHRIDPWVGAIAWRRLKSLQAPGTKFQLGLYGWVDRPYRGTAGPTSGGLLHAPSTAQALAAVILRDKAINDPQAGRWDMTLDSSAIRLAEQLADAVRTGSHIKEVLGREVERIVGDPATVEALRSDFPIKQAHDARHVCDGQAILDASPLPVALAPYQTALQPLRRAVDAYADLLVAQAVFDVVSGRAEVAGAAMDAAAGLGAPPQLEALRTPRGGRAVTTAVAFAVPARTAPALGSNPSPGKVADPSVAAFLADVLGTASTAAWRWQVTPSSGPAVNVILSALGLEPIDTIALSPDDLDRLVLAQAGGGTITSRAGSETHERARRLLNLLGSQPAQLEDLTDDGSRPDSPSIRTDLLQRYGALHQLAATLLGSLVAASNPSASAASRVAALREALRWGITPMLADDAQPPVQAARAHAALSDRVAAAPTVADAADLSAVELARAIAELASPEGRLAVLARIELDDVPAQLTLEGTESTGLTVLDHGWLEVVATVRPALARLEAHQLDAALDPGRAPFAAWTNRPGDSWQANEPADADGVVPETRLVAVYGPAGVLTPDPNVPGKAAAVGLVDSWGETIPLLEHVTTAAFGFNAPGARAPQAILLAVPPVETQPLTAEALVDILVETRELARARAALPQHLDAFSGALPLTMVPSMGTTAVSLAP